MTRLPLVGAVAGLLACALPGPSLHAQDRPPPPDAVARAAIDALRRALAEALVGLPHYAAPEINDRGDIIIRRVPPPAPAAPPRARPAPRPDAIST